MTPREYTKYGLSMRWQQLKFKILKRDNFKCTECGTAPELKNSLVAHHQTYERLENENLEDLITLCKECHKKIDHSNIPFIDNIREIKAA